MESELTAYFLLTAKREEPKGGCADHYCRFNL